MHSTRTKRRTLQPRRKPTQERSRQRVDAILDATARLLEREGVEGVSTRHIADEAAVPVGSLYQFFPNKFAILNALSRRHIERYGHEVFGRIPPMDSEFCWEVWLDHVIDATTVFLFSEKAICVLWAAMQHVTELKTIETEAMTKAMDGVTEALGRIVPTLPDERAAKLAWMITTVTRAVLFDASYSEPAQRAAKIAELKRLLRSYVADNVAC